MPKKKQPWEIKGVSKSTYFRNKRKSDAAMAGFDAQETATSNLLPEVAIGQPSPDPVMDHGSSILSETEASLISDFMVMAKTAAGSYDQRVAVAIPPRTFRAICILLDKLGY